MASSSSSLHCSLFVLLFFFLCSISEAKDFLVGGDINAWRIPSSTSDSLNRWAEATRFRVGDSLVWKYDGEKDSVLRVTGEDYSTCNTSKPITEHGDGNTSVKLDESGPYYFISGADGACEKGEKLIVVVMSERRAFGISPAPSPAEYDGPAVAQTSGAARSAVLGRGIVGGGGLVVLGVMGLVL